MARKERRNDALDELAQRALVRHLRARNMLMLEAVIAAMLDTDSPEDAARILREQADILVRYL